MDKLATVFMGVTTLASAGFVAVAMATPVYNLSPAPFFGVLTVMVLGGLATVIALMHTDTKDKEV
jgi:hypothetical protein